MQEVWSFLFENQNLRQTVLKNAFWLFFGQGIGRLLRATVVIYAARVLGASSYGAFSYALSLAAFFTIVADLGLSAVLTRSAVQEPKIQERYFATTLGLKIFFVAISFILIISIAPLFTKVPEALPLLPLVAILLIFDSLRDFSLALTRARERMEWEAAVQILTNVAVVTLGLWFLLTSPTSRNLALAYTLGSGIGLLFGFWPLRSYLFRLIGHFRRDLIAPILRGALPLAVAALLGGVMINTDMIMLNWFREAAELGFYAAAQKPVQIVYSFAALAASAAFPALSRLIKEDKKKFNQVLGEITKIMIWILLPSTLLAIIFAPWIINLLYGADYAPANLTFQILALTIVINSPAIVLINALFAAGEQKVFLFYSTLGAGGNILFNLLLIPVWGIEGAAVSTLITQIIANGYLWIKIRKLT